MSLRRELKRFDIVMEELFPELPPPRVGLDDAGIDEFRRAVAPLGLTADLETLYRWHDGLEHRLFGGKQMLTAAHIMGSRQFNISTLDHPPAWLPFTDGPDFLFVALDVPGCGSDPSVWAGHTHDVYLNLMHGSLEEMIASFNDMGTDAREPFDRRREILLGALRYGGEYRLRRSPQAYQYPGPPAGTSIVKYEMGTPEPWLRSMGASTQSLLPRGATTTIADLLNAATHGEAAGTVQGRTINVGGFIRSLGFTIDDGTGTIRLVADDAVTVIGPVSGTWVEADVTIPRDGEARLTALRRDPGWLRGDG